VGITHRQVPSASRILTALSPPDGLHPTGRRLAVRHGLAHPSRAARRQSPSRPLVSPFRLAKPSLPPGALRAKWILPLVFDSTAWQLAHAARRYTSSAMLLVFGT